MPLRSNLVDLANALFDDCLKDINFWGTSANVITVCTHGARVWLSWTCACRQPLSGQVRLIRYDEHSLISWTICVGTPYQLSFRGWVAALMSRGGKTRPRIRLIGQSTNVTTVVAVGPLFDKMLDLNDGPRQATIPTIPSRLAPYPARPTHVSIRGGVC